MIRRRRATLLPRFVRALKTVGAHTVRFFALNLIHAIEGPGGKGRRGEAD